MSKPKVQIVRFRGRAPVTIEVEAEAGKMIRHQPVHRGDELRRTSEDETRLCHSGGMGWSPSLSQPCLCEAPAAQYTLMRKHAPADAAVGDRVSPGSMKKAW